MKDFRTVVRVPHEATLLDLKTNVITTGSCFADAIGNRLLSNKMPVMVNPFGTNYNPHSIHKNLLLAIHRNVVPEHFLETDGLHYHYDFHSSFTATTQQELEIKLRKTIDKTHDFLRHAQVLMITYGTAWVYTLKGNDEVVANCHKQKSNNFSKTLFSQKHTIDSFEVFYQALKAFNPDIKIVLTVSPVRHIKDTLPLNSVSKSLLRLSCHTLTEQLADVYYFPAYEMMMDDLRDYRFYQSDMIHPNEDAEDYIWENFLSAYGSSALTNFIKQWKGIQMAMAHKPFHPQSAGHQIFLKETVRKLEELSHLVNVEQEREWLRSQIVD